jgi:hypothetical protein
MGSTAAERELTRAVRRVNERYGYDLKRFFEDVQKTNSTQKALEPQEEVDHERSSSRS